MLFSCRARRFCVLLVVACALSARPALAQDYFIPGQPKSGPAPQAPRQTQKRAPAPAPAPIPAPPPLVAAPLPGESAEAGRPDLQQQLPPPPEVPPLPKGASPPAAVIGVMGVPEVMRSSTAAVQIERTLGERREKLNEDAQREQGAWRDMQQSLVNDRSKLSSDQVRARERELQERITNSQKQLRERSRILQEAQQYALAQIERTLVSVIRQVAESRGMNLVLHRQQVALNVNEFDISAAVTDQLNKVLPSVVIPPDGVSPPTVPVPTASAVDKAAPAQPASTPPAPVPPSKAK